MTYTAQSARYLENDVLSRSPEWLVPLVYEALLANLRRASVQIDSGDIEGKARSLAVASELVAELMATLDRDRGGVIADRLASLYAYFSLEIMNVGRTLDVEHLGRLIRMLEELHGAWVRAAEQVAPRAPGSSAGRIAVSAA